MPKKVKVQLFGMTFYVVGNDDEEYVQFLADQLNDKLDNISKSYRQLSDVQVALLTALNLMDEQNHQKNQEMVISQNAADEEKARQTVQRLEEVEGLFKALEQERDQLKVGKEEKEEELTHLRSDLDAMRKELKSITQNSKQLQEEQWARDEKIKELEEQNYQRNITIVDLKKEISVLRGSSTNER